MDPAGYEDALSMPAPTLTKSKTQMIHNCDRHCKHHKQEQHQWYLDSEFMKKEKELYEEMAHLSDDEISTAALALKKKRTSLSKLAV